MSNEFNISSTLPKDLRIQLEILANEEHISIDNLIMNILINHVENEFSD